MERGEELLARCRALTDERLVGELRSSAARERAEVALTVARLAEMHRRRLVEDGPAPSLFAFCVRQLGYCEATAYYRSKAAEAVVRFPRLLELLESGELSVPATALLARHLAPENFATLTERAKGRSRREVEALVAGFDPRPKPPETTRVIAVTVQPPPAATGGEPAPASAKPPRTVIRHEHRFTFDEEAEAKLARARELLSHKFPSGELESIFFRRAGRSARRDRSDAAKAASAGGSPAAGSADPARARVGEALRPRA